MNECGDGSQQNVKYDLLAWIRPTLIGLGYGWIGCTQTPIHHNISREETEPTWKLSNRILYRLYIHIEIEPTMCGHDAGCVFLTADLRSEQKLSMTFVGVGGAGRERTRCVGFSG